VTLAASSVWGRRASVVRPVFLPEPSTVIGVGGSTLGGSHKTPLALALAVELRRRGEDVRVVGHGYGVRDVTARAVLDSDTARTVGDDAAWLARELRPCGVPVYVGERSAALALAAAPGAVVLVDGLLQAHPRRLALSLLVVDAHEPWGSGACPPAGDLRATPRALMDATDAIVAVHSGALPSDAPSPDVHDVATSLTALHADGTDVALASLARRRVGVVLAIARPERVLRSLRARGIEPVTTLLFADHGALPERRAPSHRGAVDLWLTTPKCATKLGAEFEGAPLAVLRQELALPDELLARCLAAVRKAR
jgi:tetraacyldisaccharide 4'-kinase